MWARLASSATTQRRGACACIGAILLLLVVAAGVWLAVRYYGLRAGWWPTLLPMHQPTVHALLSRVLFRIDR
jgi:hypothetical protein